MSAAVLTLRPKVRKAIELRDLSELSTAETALQMALSVGAVRGRVFHGRRKLREPLMRYITAPRKAKFNSRELATSAASA